MKIKSNILGIEKLHLYDLGVPLENKFKKNYSIDESIEIIKNALKPLGKDYLEAVDYLLEGHIDAVPEENKH